MSENWNDRVDRFEKKPVRTSIRWGFILVALFTLLALVLTIAGFAAGWFGTAVDTAGPKNVKKQYAAIIADWEALTTTAGNACAVGSAVTPDENAPVLTESPQLAYSATYRNVRASYNAKQANIFEAKLVGPPGYPDSIPDFAEAGGVNPDFCIVVEKLAELQLSQ